MVSVHDIRRSVLYFYPSLQITQRRISMELLEHIIDLDVKIRMWEWFNVQR